MAGEDDRPRPRPPRGGTRRPGGPRSARGGPAAATGPGLTISGFRVGASRVALAAGLVLLIGVASGCGQSASTVSATGPCTADIQVSGAYPALEAQVPRELGGASATTVDSGRKCTDTALGTLTSHQVHDLRFAGATWDLGRGDATTIAILALPAGRLPLEWAEEFYLAGALNGNKTDNVKSSHPNVPGVNDALRIDALNDLSQQAIVLWQVGDEVRVVIVATEVSPNASMAQHEARVAAAIAAAVAVSPSIPVVSPS